MFFRWLRRWCSVFLSLGEGVGRRGESLAAAHLKAKGYRIVARNWRTRVGEVDLVVMAPNATALVIVEVKTSQVIGGRPPELRVSQDQRRRLVQMAAEASRRLGGGSPGLPVRFDVVAVELGEGGQGRDPVIRHHEGAFEAGV